MRDVNGFMLSAPILGQASASLFAALQSCGAGISELSLSALEALAWHRENVNKVSQPELEFDHD